MSQFWRERHPNNTPVLPIMLRTGGSPQWVEAEILLTPELKEDLRKLLSAPATPSDPAAP